MGPILPEFPPTIIHLIFCDRSIKQGPSIIVDGISKWKEGKLQNHYKISNNDESQILCNIIPMPNKHFVPFLGQF